MDNFFDMHIRKLTHADIPRASALCLEAFTLAVAPSLSEQGVETFAKVAAEQAFAERMQGDNLTWSAKRMATSVAWLSSRKAVM